MNLFQNITIKRITAFGILVLMLLIQGVKVFHTHLCYGKPCKASTAKTQFAPDKRLCSICDFQFFKEGETTNASIQVTRHQFQVSLAQGFQTRSVAVHQYHVFFRGPPTI